MLPARSSAFKRRAQRRGEKAGVSHHFRLAEHPPHRGERSLSDSHTKVRRSTRISSPTVLPKSPTRRKMTGWLQGRSESPSPWWPNPSNAVPPIHHSRLAEFPTTHTISCQPSRQPSSQSSQGLGRMGWRSSRRQHHDLPHYIGRRTWIRLPLSGSLRRPTTAWACRRSARTKSSAMSPTPRVDAIHRMRADLASGGSRGASCARCAGC